MEIPWFLKSLFNHITLFERSSQAEEDIVELDLDLFIRFSGM